MNMMSGLFDWIVVIWAVFVILLTLLMLIRIQFSVFCLVFLQRSCVKGF